MLEEIFVVNRLVLFVLTILVAVVLLVTIRQAKKGKKFFIRGIAGLEAIDEARGPGHRNGTSRPLQPRHRCPQ